MFLDIEVGVSMDNWISTKERLPEMEEDVLISTRYSIYIAYRKGNGLWQLSDSNFHDDVFEPEQVLAWMPLPKKYHERRGTKK